MSCANEVCSNVGDGHCVCTARVACFRAETCFLSSNLAVGACSSSNIRGFEVFLGWGPPVSTFQGNPFWVYPILPTTAGFLTFLWPVTSDSTGDARATAASPGERRFERLRQRPQVAPGSQPLGRRGVCRCARCPLPAAPCFLLPGSRCFGEETGRRIHLDGWTC